ncbi:unnamed protein product [Mesocestoides corti]|uniref:Uncharacterized protein n=1 Tax=Mesocestoides corti TaxID=53468 RepID=A0A158QTJ3_MESCO|nr:unnamed protein product [Mesocestoides corti]
MPSRLDESKPFDSMRPAAVFLPLGLLVLLVGGGGGLGSAACSRGRRRWLLVFVAGGSCIVSGILTLITIVLYVGSVSLAFDSVSGPLRVETRYVYSFGAAFRLCVGAFILSEFTGVFSIYLFLAEMRHRQNLHNKSTSLRYNLADSVSTDIVSPSGISTKKKPVAQIALTENCLDKVKAGDNYLLPIIKRPPLSNNGHFPLSNHVGNPFHVKVMSYTKSLNTSPFISTCATHSLESLDPMEYVKGNNLDEVVCRAPMKRRRMAGHSSGSTTNMRSVGRLRQRNARSAGNIRAEIELPDFVQFTKSGRCSKQTLFSCRECELLLKQHGQTRHFGRSPSDRSPSPHQIPTSETPSTNIEESMTSSASSSYSSCPHIGEKQSNKLYYSVSPRRLPRSPCIRQRSITSVHKQIPRRISTKKNPQPMTARVYDDTTNSESEMLHNEIIPVAVCRCSSKLRTNSYSEVDNFVPTSEVFVAWLPLRCLPRSQDEEKTLLGGAASVKLEQGPS